LKLERGLDQRILCHSFSAGKERVSVPQHLYGPRGGSLAGTLLLTTRVPKQPVERFPIALHRVSGPSLLILEFTSGIRIAV
jgi:hypothetical protein